MIQKKKDDEREETRDEKVHLKIGNSERDGRDEKRVNNFLYIEIEKKEKSKRLFLFCYVPDKYHPSIVNY